MDRAADFESVGREFESPQARHVFNQALGRQAGNPVTLSAAMAFEASVLGDCHLHPRPPGVEVIPSWRGAMREAVITSQGAARSMNHPVVWWNTMSPSRRRGASPPRWPSTESRSIRLR